MKHIHNSWKIITLTATLIALIFTSISVFAVEGLSANIGVTNNYLWRGVTQTTNDAAISGGIDYTSKSGFYTGAWTSNANWANNMTYELDLYGGLSGDLGKGFGYDVGYIYYNYDNAANSNFSEVYAKLSYSFFTLGYNTLVNSDTNGSFGDDTYITGDATFEIADDLSLGLHVGNYNFNTGGNYTDYGISLSKAGFTFALGDSNIDGADGDLNITVAYSIDFNL